MSIQIKVPKEHLLALIFWPTVSIFEISMSSSEILAKARHIINSKYKKVGACSSLSTTMSKPVNNHVQAGQLNHVQTGQLNHVQACQQPCSSWRQLNHVQACQHAKQLCVFTCTYTQHITFIVYYKLLIDLACSVCTSEIQNLFTLTVICNQSCDVCFRPIRCMMTKLAIVKGCLSSRRFSCYT